MTRDELLDASMDPAYPVGYDLWVGNFRQIENEAKAWYVRAFNRTPAESDIAHGLWRAANEGPRWGTLRQAWNETWPGGDVPVPTPPIVVVPAPVLTVRGRSFYNGEVLWVARMVSGLSLLAKSREQQEAFFSWASATGFNGVRVFAGALAWAGQTPESACAALPTFLNAATTRGLAVEVTALTDTGTGYDMRAHVATIVDILRGRKNVLLEIANEIGHHTQHSDLTLEYARQLGQELATPAGILWAVGAPLETDEPINGIYPGHGGSYSTSHLDRARDSWNNPRRVREIYAIVEAHGSPALNNEPIGAGTRYIEDRRWTDPAMFFTFGALERAFGTGGVHHSTAGLNGELPAGVQQGCAETYVAGHAAINSALPGVIGKYYNVGHSGSPLLSATFVEGGNDNGVVRAYSFIDGNRGVAVLLGLKGDAGLEWGNGWAPLRIVHSLLAQDGRMVTVVELKKA